MERVFDSDSLRWYRRFFEERNPGRRQELSDKEFLHEWGFVRELPEGRLAPTRAAVLVLGRARYVRQVLARPVVDCQFVNATFDAWSPDLRWDDRIVVEENLVQAWLTLSERFVQRAERPFRIDPGTMRRDDDPLDYVAFRESTINLLLHQDYGDQGRKPCIRFFRDRMAFWNPGDAFANTDQLLEPSEKEVRNPNIVAAFRRLGLSEQAGTGIRAIFRNWQALGHVPPLIDNDKAGKAFEVCFLQEPLLSEAQQVLQSRLGLHLNDTEARVFAFACREGRVSVVDAKAVTGFMGAQAAETLEALHVQGVLRPLDDGLYALAEHLEGRADLPQPDMSTAYVSHRPADMSTAHGHEQANMSTEPAVSSAESDRTSAELPASGSGHVQDRQAETVTGQADMSTAHVPRKAANRPIAYGGGAATQSPSPAALSAVQRRIVAYCDVPRLLAEMMGELGVSNRGHFKKNHLDPLIHDGLIAMTNPAKPRAPGQRYVLSEAGVRLRAFYMNAEQ